MFKRLFWLTLWVLGGAQAGAYSINGPYETYQTAALGYTYQGDQGGPHNLGEEYRRNTPVLYYTFDQSFLDYFGTNGVAAIEEAFAIYNSLTNVSSYSSNLSEWPMETRSFNFKAQALGLTDLKSYFLCTLTEQMGLSMPERYVWTLHDRDVGPGGCPADVTYLVHQRNFEPTFSAQDILQTSSYVNGALYSYIIVEGCTTTPVVAEAVEFAVDPLADSFNSVAGFNLIVGSYFNGLTRDDVGGLRYLLRANNLNVESTGPDTVTFITNNVPQQLFTSNLFEFVTAALTNNAAALAALYPNLQIGSTTPIFTNVITTNTVFFFTNSPFLPAGTPVLRSVTFLTTNATTHFSHTFLNVFITPAYQLVSNLQVPLVPGHSTNAGVIQLLTTNISTTACPPFYPAGQICTNIENVSVPTAGFFGDYYILPTNFCSVQLLSTQLVQPIGVTNATIVATNAPGTTNAVGESFSQTPTYTFDQYVYIINGVTCPTNYVDRRQGVERIRFVRYDGGFDSFTGLYNFPITNQYTLTAMQVTNPTPVLQTVRRRVGEPDIVISALDSATEGNVGTRRGGNYTITGFGQDPVDKPINFNQANVLPGLYGPGTIDPATELAINKVGPLFVNITPFNLDETTQVAFFTWGSFDGSTNDPVVYPNGTSILAYEQSLFIVVTPNLLPEGYVAATPAYTNYYSAQLTATSYSPSFTPPFTWSLAPTSPGGLPPGLTLTTLNATNGLISGTPTVAGPTGTTYDFVVRVTDSQSRTTDRSYFILVRP